MSKLIFSGHESFHCRSLWLNKGHNFISSGKSFSNKDAVVDLGVGKNMVSSIAYWMKAFGLADNQSFKKEISEVIFGENGVDVSLENPFTLWLLHFHLIIENYASIYSLVFNDFRKQRIEFNKKQLHNFLVYKCLENKVSISENSIERDITIFLRNYVKPHKAKRNLEEIYNSIFIDIDLIEELKKYDEEESRWFKIENKDRLDIPAELILYAIISIYGEESSITFDDLCYGFNSPGNIFCLTPKGLLSKIQSIVKDFKGISFKDDAGIRILQIKKNYDKWEVLRKVYEK